MATGSTSSWVPDGDFTGILRVDCRLSKVRDRRLLSLNPWLDRLVEPCLKPSARRCVFDQSSATSPFVTTVWLDPAWEPIPAERRSATLQRRRRSRLSELEHRDRARDRAGGATPQRPTGLRVVGG